LRNQGLLPKAFYILAFEYFFKYHIERFSRLAQEGCDQCIPGWNRRAVTSKIFILTNAPHYPLPLVRICAGGV